MRRLYIISPILLAIFIILIVTATMGKSDDPHLVDDTPDQTAQFQPTQKPTSTPLHTKTIPDPTLDASPLGTSPLGTSPLGTSPTEVPKVIYTVLPGDTLWDIAFQFDTTVIDIIAANPDLNAAGIIFPGNQLVIPGSLILSAATTAEIWPVTAQVSTEGSGLRLREGPSLDHEVILTLAASTPLTVTGRTSDNTWLEVRTIYADFGWVFAEWVDVLISLEHIPISRDIIPTESPTETGAPENATATPDLSPHPEAYLYISGVSEHVIEIFNHGQELGNRSNIFSKVGDSITVSDAFLYPIGTRNYALHDYSYLQPVIDTYSESWARTHNSFANVSLAASIGWSAHALLAADVSHETLCGETETPLECEYRWMKPSIALIMLGTNDVPSTSLNGYETAMREIIETTIDYGIIPILSTIPPMQMAGTEGRVDSINAIISNLANEYDIPLWDYWAALQGLPDDGLRSDGVHPSLAPAGQNANFTAGNLQYGMPVRSLTALQALDLVWRTVLPEG